MAARTTDIAVQATHDKERSMSAEQNTQRAKDGYAAFMRGDIPAVIEFLADDIEWVTPGPSDIPVAGTYTGKQAVLAFFGVLGENLEFHVFEPREFIAQGDTVVALIHGDATVRRTGRRIVQDEAHVWTFRDGKVARLHLFQDTAAAVAAFRGE
jgi:ketosteroid isomerase-like protein